MSAQHGRRAGSGLGKMGSPMAARLAGTGYQVTGAGWARPGRTSCQSCTAIPRIDPTANSGGH
jgi:hypothetical protein